MRMYRQGDVLIVEQQRFNMNCLKPAANNILVYGEVTGHAHRVEEISSVVVFDSDFGGKFIIAHTPFRLIHDEHETITIPEGNYRVIRQREYDEKEIRYVRD